MKTFNRRQTLSLIGAAAAAPVFNALPARAAGKFGYEDMRTYETPPLSLPTLDGEEQSLATHKGNVLMLNFWADWCPPCLHEIPSLHRAWILLRKDGVELQTVHVGGTAKSIRQFMQDNGFKFPVWVDAEAATFRAWPTMGLPTTFIIDRNGKMALGAAGAREWDTAEMLDPIRAIAAAGA